MGPECSSAPIPDFSASPTRENVSLKELGEVGRDVSPAVMAVLQMAFLGAVGDAVSDLVGFPW